MGAEGLVAPGVAAAAICPAWRGGREPALSPPSAVGAVRGPTFSSA